MADLGDRLGDVSCRVEAVRRLPNELRLLAHLRDPTGVVRDGAFSTKSWGERRGEEGRGEERREEERRGEERRGEERRGVGVQLIARAPSNDER